MTIPITPYTTVAPVTRPFTRRRPRARAIAITNAHPTITSALSRALERSRRRARLPRAPFVEPPFVDRAPGDRDGGAWWSVTRGSRVLWTSERDVSHDHDSGGATGFYVKNTPVSSYSGALATIRSRCRRARRLYASRVHVITDFGRCAAHREGGGGGAGDADFGRRALGAWAVGSESA